MSDDPLPNSEFILYQTEDGRTRVQCRFEDETLWLTQAQIAELFETTPQNVTLHLKAIFAERELVELATCKDYLQVRLEGGREVCRKLRHYRLEAILVVGFRVRSHRGTQFRQWATARLGEYLVKGFTMDDERLKNPSGKDSRITSTNCWSVSGTSVRRSGGSTRKCSIFTRRAWTTRRMPNTRSVSSPLCRTRCTGPHTATPAVFLPNPRADNQVSSDSLMRLHIHNFHTPGNPPKIPPKWRDMECRPGCFLLNRKPPKRPPQRLSSSFSEESLFKRKTGNL